MYYWIYFPRRGTGQKLDVVFGGGRRMFSPVWVEDLETRQPGLRGDFDLIAEWTADKVTSCFIIAMSTI